MIKLDIQKFATAINGSGEVRPNNWTSNTWGSYVNYFRNYVRIIVSWTYDDTTQTCIIQIGIKNNGSQNIGNFRVTGGSISCASKTSFSINPRMSSSTTFTSGQTITLAQNSVQLNENGKIQVSISTINVTTGAQGTGQGVGGVGQFQVILPIKINNNILNKVFFNGTELTHLYKDGTQIF